MRSRPDGERLANDGVSQTAEQAQKKFSKRPASREKGEELYLKFSVFFVEINTHAWGV
jgi:hypothetical protein